MNTKTEKPKSFGTKTAKPSRCPPPIWRTFQSQCHQELLYRLDALRRKESFFDVTVSVKDKEFKAHRLVLAASSPFFLSLLVSDMREGKEQFIRIELEEATGSVMEEVLKYIYTGNVAVTKETAHDLVAVAEYLLLPGLKNLACDVLEENIAIENCIIFGRIQNMDPRSMDHPRGPGPWTPSWTPSWTRSMDYPCGPPLILRRTLYGDSITGILYKIDDNVCEAVADPLTVERFDPILATWEEVAAMNEARYKAFGAAMNGKIYVAGGINAKKGRCTVLKSCEVYDPSTDEWQVMNNLEMCRHGANMVCIQEALFVVGGFKDAQSSSRELLVEVFQLRAHRWKSKSTIPFYCENKNTSEAKKKIHYKACLATIHKSINRKAV
ncbi:kelch-like protein 18 [Montipora foliosa]|uniref:kelch-like protein 18 n=1 Tax=Montipora foliosa TaxID=591990 RepID=UPI0035F13932